MDIIREFSLPYNGLVLDIEVTNFVHSQPMPIASTPDCIGYDSDGEAAHVDYDIVGVVIDCQQTFIDAGGVNLEDNDEIRDLVIEEMER